MIHPLIIRFFTYGGAYLFGAGICEIMTDIGKMTVGELRPHFIDACQPDWSRINCTGHQYVTDFVCLNIDSGLIREARQSFPSAHASFAAFSACFVVLYLRKRASWPLSPSTGRLIRPLVQYLVIIAAFVTGLTRIADYVHHPTDVLFGFALGIGTAVSTCYQFDILGEERVAEFEKWTSLVSKSASLGDTRIDKETTALLYRN